MPRIARDVVFVDGVRTPFGKAGPKGLYAETRADDLVVRAIRELIRRNPGLPPDRVDEVSIAATTQTGDQGLTIGRSAAVLAGLPKSVPGYAIDRMCAGAMTAVTTTASGIAFGAYDVVIAGGVEHMGRHPMGEGVDPNPRFMTDKIVDPSALVMGLTAENLHDRYPEITKERCDAYAVRSQEKVAAAYAAGRIQQDLVPTAVRSAEKGWGLATADEPPRPGTTARDLAALKTPFRVAGNVTAGNAAGLNDGATACLLMAEEVARELGLPARMRLVDFAFAGVEPEVMGIGPVPATERLLARNGLSVEDIGLFEINEAFAVQVLAFLDHFKIDEEDPRVTKALVRDVELPHGAGTMALITLDNGFDRTKPNTFGPNGLKHPERVVGFHFFNPVAVLPLLEIVRAERTDDATLATAFAVGRQLRKSCLLVEDAPAFVLTSSPA